MDYATPGVSYAEPQFPVSDSMLDFHFDLRRRPVFRKLGLQSFHKKNDLLAALPDAEYERLKPYLELVPLEVGSTLHEAGGHLRFAYFPISGIVSPLCVMENGAAAAVAITGNDGMIGTSLFMGGGATSNRALVQSAGHAYRIGASRIKREFERGADLCHLLLRYTHSLIMQMAQTAACNRYHSIEQQFCRWLLLMRDRTAADEMSLTHELLANILGVRREGITDAAGKLQDAGIIRCRRGHITIVDRPAMEERVCECYAVVIGKRSHSVSHEARCAIAGA